MKLKVGMRRARVTVGASLLAVSALIVSSIWLIPQAFADTSGPWTYTVFGGEATITAYDFAIGGATPDVPATLGGSPVVTLDSGVFSAMDITAVTLPNSLKHIGNGAFSDTDLTSVTFPGSLETIGNSAFAGAPLAAVSVPNSVTSIMAGAFANTNASTIVIGAPGFSGTPSLAIEGGAFAGISTPMTVTIYDNLSTIQNGALSGSPITSLTIGTNEFTGTPTVVIPSGFLSGASNLKSLTLGKNVVSVGSSAFVGSALETVTLSEGLTTIDYGAFSFSQVASVNLPSTLTTIGNYAFQSVKLTTIDIPGTVQTVGDSAFQDTTLSSVALHEGTTSLGARAFSGTQLDTFILPVSVTSLGSDLLSGSTVKHLTIGSTSFSGAPTYTVPSYVFSGMSSLQSVTFGKNVRAIDDNAFAYGNSALATVNFPDTLESIGNYAFNSTGLISVSFPSSLTTIGSGAFLGTKLGSLHIPLTITSIGDGAFTNIHELTSVTIGDATFSGTPTLALPNSFVAGADGLTTVSIGKNVVSIGAGAFGGTSKLASLTIPDSVTFIGEGAFAGSGLTSLTILGNPTVEDGAFRQAGLDGSLVPDGTYTGAPMYAYRQNNAQLLQIHAPNPALAAALGPHHMDTNRTLANIYSSSDSGATWTPLTTPATQGWLSITGSSDGTKLISRLSLFEQNPGTTYGSDDGGATWASRVSYASGFYLTDIASNSDGSRLVGAQYNSSNSTQGNVFTSTDGGVTWVPGTTPNTSRFDSVATSADGTKMVATANRSTNNTNTNVYTSVDSGATWTARTTPNSRYWKGITSSDDGTYLAAFTDYNGLIYTSSNSGVSWTARATNRPWRDIANSSTGQYLVAVAGSQNIYTSSDYGVTWVERSTSGTRNWVSASMSSSGQYIIAADTSNGYSTTEGWLYYSTDYGATWTQKQIGGETHNWISIFMSDDGTKMFAVHAGGDIATHEQTFVTGGYIVNPASVNATFVNKSNASLSTSIHYTARIAGVGDALDTYRSDYKLLDAIDWSNPNSPVLDFSPYFLKGSSPITITPPAISGYTTPAAFTYTFTDSGVNQHAFVYDTLDDDATSPGDDSNPGGGSQGGDTSGGRSGSEDSKSGRAGRSTVVADTDTAESVTDVTDTTDTGVQPDTPQTTGDTSDGLNGETATEPDTDGSLTWWLVGGGALLLLILLVLLFLRRRTDE